MPVVTITRILGAGGSEVASALAARLGWTLLDNALIERVASRLHTTPAFVEAIEERSPSLAERIADTFAFSAPEVLSASLAGGALAPTEERLLAVTHQVIDDAVARGPVVLVGRGAQAWLANREDAVHVLCVAPPDACVARVARREGTPEGEARTLVEATNRQRQDFVRRHWGREWRDPAHYHVCVNTEALGIAGAVDAALAVARARFGASTGTP